EVRGWIDSQLSEAVFNQDKATREAAVEGVKKALLAEMSLRGFEEKPVAKLFDAMEKETVRGAILDRGLRPDGRGLTEIRPSSCEVGVLPRTHGSGLFTRGQTQVLSICTLGTASNEQIIDGIGTDTSKRFMHHYNFPRYSTGEAKRMAGPSRRDIGHGHLVERSVPDVLPEKEDFAYTIRLVAEVVSSNGTTS